MPARRARASTSSNLINLQQDERREGFPVRARSSSPDQFVVMVTKQGVIKKCELTEFDNPMSRGIIAVSLDEGDELIAAIISDRVDLYLPRRSHEGMAIKFDENDVRAMGRPAGGVRADATWIGRRLHYRNGDRAAKRVSFSRSRSIGFGKRTQLQQISATAPRR
ncbi:MAG: DNA gyrase C-terminal beta-propeller domain-containing protein [Paludibaculum sp.]